MHFFVSRLMFPLAVLGSFLFFLYQRATGGSMEIALALPGLLILVAAVAVERFVPFEREWNKGRGDFATDLTSTGVAMGVTEPFLKWLGPVLVVAVYGASPVSGALFPAELPFALQLVVVLLVAEFGSYWIHRWHHTNKHLWWLHALHHSSRRLYALNNFRTHPVNHALSSIAGLFPLMLIGAPADVLFAYLALTQPVLMLQHANLPFRNGWLNYIFSTNEVHRWHHSTLPSEANNNFGRAIVFWDIVFDTFRYVPNANIPEDIGLFGDGNYPGQAGYFMQLVSYFRRNEAANVEGVRAEGRRQPLARTGREMNGN
jgi:sterol desaturase/sphingolipid hydroxylase (fatty acid hydroxylase superfamily)